MADGDFFSIDKEDLEVMTGIFDDMENTFSSVCKIIYKTTETICPNCIINPRTGESMNRYKTGGPIPFDAGEICPVCEGRGRVQDTSLSDLINMTIDWRPKPWMNLGQSNNSDQIVRIPSGTVTATGFSKDIPKILRADYVLLDIENQYITNKYKLSGDPYMFGSITNRRYFFSVWEKAE
jgi:hypothetical protein